MDVVVEVDVLVLFVLVDEEEVPLVEEPFCGVVLEEVLDVEEGSGEDMVAGLWMLLD